MAADLASAPDPLEDHDQPSENPAGLVYGTVTVAALLAAESVKHETYLRTVASVMITLVLYWLAHAYAEYAGHRIEHEQHFAYGALARTAAHEFAVVLGATIPLLVLLGGWVFGAPLETAALAAIWTAAGTIVILELVIGIRAGLSGGELAKQTLFGALLGLLVIALRVVLH